MTISSTYEPVQYNGNGVTTVFAFPYEFYNSTDLIVKSTVIATGVTTTLTSPTDYSVSGGSGSTGNVTFVSAPAATVRITIERSIPYTQGQDYQENTAFPAATIETGFDKSVIMAQQTKALTDYALKFETTDPTASIGTIPNSVSRANAILSFDALGKPSAVTLASLGADINVSLTSPQNGDALVYNTGSWVNRSVLASLGTNIASATTTAISAADSDFVTVTGTTTITSFGTPASFARKHIWVVFAGALTLTHNATSLILPGGASITTAAGDVAECVHISGANWRVVTYERANGQAVVGGAAGLLSNGGYKTGRFYSGFGCYSSTDAAISSGTIFVVPFVVPATTVFTAIGVKVTSAGGNARFGIYNFANGEATTLVLDAGTVSVASLGDKEAAISQSLSPGIYALAVNFSATTSVPLMDPDSFNILSHFLGANASNLGVTNALPAMTSAFGALPATFTLSTYVATTSCPLIYVRT